MSYTQTAAANRARKILKETPVDHALEGASLEFMMALFHRHPSFPEKTKGLDLTGIYVRGVYAQKIFYFFGLDENRNYAEGEFSFVKSAAPRLAAPGAVEAKVFRGAIREQTDEFRRRHSSHVRCALCAEEGFNPEGEHSELDHSHLQTIQVDHDMGHAEFSDLVRGFKEENEDYAPVWITKNRFGCGVNCFADETMEERWQAYHRQRAVLRFLCRKCNGRETRKRKRIGV